MVSYLPCAIVKTKLKLLNIFFFSAKLSTNSLDQVSWPPALHKILQFNEYTHFTKRLDMWLDLYVNVFNILNAVIDWFFLMLPTPHFIICSFP